MATGVKPRDEDIQLSRIDLETIQDAMKQKKFRDMFKDYFDEVRDPANQAKFQKEMTQLEKERGYNVTFINPKGGYVIKTSVAGDRKAFINICSNDNVAKPSCRVQEVDGQRGMNWQIPYSIIPPREDYTAKKERVVLYDVVFHPDTLRMAEVNKQFRELVNKTAFDGLAKTYDIHLDNNNCRFPKSQYKGMAMPAVIRKEDPNYVPPTEEECENLTPDLIEKLYPQRNYSETSKGPSCEVDSKEYKESKAPTPSQPKPIPTGNNQQKRKARRGPAEFNHTTENGYTIPKYVIKQQKDVDFQDFTYNKDCKQYSAIPSQIVVEVNMPLLSSTKDCTLDVQEKTLSLKSEKPAKYKLNITLPYAVNDECGSAKFDKSKHKLIVTLPVIRKTLPSANVNDCESKSLKVDSGVESEENSGSHSEEESNKENLIVELSSTPAEAPVKSPEKSGPKEELFFNPNLGYSLPTYTHNVMDDIVAFTFHVKNTEPDSVKVRKDGNKISVKFTSVGSSFVPVHYGAIIVFDENVNFEDVTGEAWDNNVILQMELAGDVPQKFQIGLSEDSMTPEQFETSQLKKTDKLDVQKSVSVEQEESTPVVEVTNLGTETNIVVSSTVSEYDEDDDDLDSPTAKDEEIVWTDPGPVRSDAKSILRKPNMMRSYSESSVGDVASSMDYISSDYIHEGSSFKKTVRFSDVIARQFYRYNSSIEGQKKKNQRKKSKKRNQEQRKSESEAEDDVFSLSKVSKPKLKSALKPRRDSGLADTSDAEADCRNTPLQHEPTINSRKHDANECGKKSAESDTNENKNSQENSVLNIVDNNGNSKENAEPVIWESVKTESKQKEVQSKPKSEPITCENIKHRTDFYNPDRLNKGQYLEVKFKNDLIFDLDM
ncbi:pre-RNA processing PIH1/Nop17 domain-containing protein [Phthorimaea operculella]|nr:pre-RNA processing PIH1/Nop17 domain-containing protein [Phthorimaea operculella]